MGRPAKAVDTLSGHLTDAEKNMRKKAETALKGNSNKIIPPDYLTEEQSFIFNYIVSELEASGILSNLDIYILATCSIAIDRLQNIETQINENIEKLCSKELMSAKDKYTKDLYRCCNELSLSPQSRAKIANINISAKEENPLIKLLGGN